MPSRLPWQNQSCCTTRLCGIGRLPKMVKGVCAPRINHERCPSSKGGHHTQSHLLSRQPCPPQHSPAFGRCTHVSCRRQNGTFKMSPAKHAKVDAEISGVLGFFASIRPSTIWAVAGLRPCLETRYSVKNTPFQFRKLIQIVNVLEMGMNTKMLKYCIFRGLSSSKILWFKRRPYNSFQLPQK